MKTSRLLLVVMMYPPPLFGGARVYLYQLMANLPSGHGSVLTNSAGDPVGEAAFDQQQIYITIRMPFNFDYNAKYSTGEKIRLMLLWIAALWKWIPTANVVMLGNVYHLGIITRVFCAIHRAPYIVFGFGEELSMVQNSGRSRQEWLRRWLYRWTYRGAAGIVSISRETTTLIRNYTNAPVCEIFPPTAVPKTHPASPTLDAFLDQYGLHNRRIIASVGRLVRRKGFDYLLRAMPQVVQQVPDCLLIIASTGPLEAELHEMVRTLNLSNHVIFFGKVERDVLDSLYAVCEFFIMPNRRLANGDQEGYGIVFNEANSFGKAVIGGNSGGTPDAVIDGKNGILVNPDSIASIADAMLNFLSNPTWAQSLGKWGREWVSTERSPHAAGEKLAEFVREIEDINRK